MDWIKDSLAEIAKAKEFNAVLTSSIVVVGIMIWVVSELLNAEWVSQSKDNQ